MVAIRCDGVRMGRVSGDAVIRGSRAFEFVTDAEDAPMRLRTFYLKQVAVSARRRSSNLAFRLRLRPAFAHLSGATGMMTREATEALAAAAMHAATARRPDLLTVFGPRWHPSVADVAAADLAAAAAAASSVPASEIAWEELAQRFARASPAE